MPSFLDRLFRRPGKAPKTASPAQAELARSPNPVAIPVPEGMPPELLQRVPSHKPRDPSRKRKRRTKEEIATDRKAFADGMMRQARLRFDFDRDQAERIGATQYRWRSAGDGDVCKVCRSRNGRQFPYRAADDFDHPGFMLCVCPPIDDDDEASSHPCRCSAEPILPK